MTEVASGSESQATEELGDQQSQESTEDTKPQLETPPKSPEPKQLQEEKGNCQIVSYKDKEKDDLEKMLWNKGGLVNDYYTILCENANENTDSNFPNDWAELFPNKLFTWRDALQVGKRVEIKMKVEKQESETEDYKIFFTSNDFQKSEIIGEWRGEVTQSGEDQFKAIKIQKPEVDFGQDYIYIATKLHQYLEK
ncbi:hypothetical protein OVS_00210 [Mycoplasma ovis str. Michigan]|uniref:Lipoprotein n=1 Tax=Mycoplasma ovis str. Michigan TaxID=1415773 RepID=A0ABM5P1C1_9MOLU|nr:hypothetical protein [Mycoplasma ovis]AHC40082.1 hypothetical protein OVS_00210 [Mycoplasma ovis str. Michigan]